MVLVYWLLDTTTLDHTYIRYAFLLFTCTETKDKIFIVRKYNQFNRNITEELEILQVCPSANFYDCKAMSIGARSQSARTYLEKKLDDFGDCELEPLVAHGLRALRDTLPKEVDLTNKVKASITFEIMTYMKLFLVLQKLLLFLVSLECFNCYRW